MPPRKRHGKKSSKNKSKRRTGSCAQCGERDAEIVCRECVQLGLEQPKKNLCNFCFSRSRFAREHTKLHDRWTNNPQLFCLHVEQNPAKSTTPFSAVEQRTMRYRRCGGALAVTYILCASLAVASRQPKKTVRTFLTMAKDCEMDARTQIQLMYVEASLYDRDQKFSEAAHLFRQMADSAGDEDEKKRFNELAEIMTSNAEIIELQKEYKKEREKFPETIHVTHVDDGRGTDKIVHEENKEAEGATSPLELFKHRDRLFQRLKDASLPFVCSVDQVLDVMRESELSQYHVSPVEALVELHLISMLPLASNLYWNYGGTGDSVQSIRTVVWKIAREHEDDEQEIGKTIRDSPFLHVVGNVDETVIEAMTEMRSWHELVRDENFVTVSKAEADFDEGVAEMLEERMLLVSHGDMYISTTGSLFEILKELNCIVEPNEVTEEYIKTLLGEENAAVLCPNMAQTLDQYKNMCRQVNQLDQKDRRIRELEKENKLLMRRVARLEHRAKNWNTQKTEYDRMCIEMYFMDLSAKCRFLRSLYYRFYIGICPVPSLSVTDTFQAERNMKAHSSKGEFPYKRQQVFMSSNKLLTELDSCVAKTQELIARALVDGEPPKEQLECIVSNLRELLDSPKFFEYRVAILQSNRQEVLRLLQLAHDEEQMCDT